MATAVQEKKFEKTMSLRDPEFTESYDGFIATSTLKDDVKLPKEEVNLLEKNLYFV